MRRIIWVKAALKDFKRFPVPVQDQVMFACGGEGEGHGRDAVVIEWREVYDGLVRPEKG